MSKKNRKAKKMTIQEYQPKEQKPKKLQLRDILKNIYYGTFNPDSACNYCATCCKTAMPGIHYSEATQVLQTLWDSLSKSEKVELICKSIEYYLKNDYDKFGMDTLVKPCMLLTEKGLCKIYNDRPLNCRLYGLWPKSVYERRVDKFAKAYEGKLKRHELPLCKQCPNVKRKDDKQPLTEENINMVYSFLDGVDEGMGNFTKVQLEQKANYRTLHDWVLYFFFGEEWLEGMTKFMLAGTKEEILDLIEQLKIQVRKTFESSIPNLKI